MFIVRWLMGHPIIAAWVLAAVAIGLNLGSVKDEEHAVSPNNESIVSSKDVVGKNSSENSPDLTKSTLNISDKNLELKKSQLETSNSQGVAISEVSSKVGDLRETSTSEMLLMAREAYWNNGLEEAVQIYSQLIEIEPNVVEHKGELGNVYWKLGNTKKAADIYSEISMPLIANGKTDIVNNMLGLIGQYYPDRAKVIQMRLGKKVTTE